MPPAAEISEGDEEKTTCPRRWPSLFCPLTRRGPLVNYFYVLLMPLWVSSWECMADDGLRWAAFIRIYYSLTVTARGRTALNKIYVYSLLRCGFCISLRSLASLQRNGTDSSMPLFALGWMKRVLIARLVHHNVQFSTSSSRTVSIIFYCFN